ncbi:MAG TPA: DUF5694 domain-containing protein [Thermoanaerobaculia bacterium]|jgi:hypothetical protein|nr:DUF5694 domain-containing protein [Thermoanaerobaculia bacterium]
MDYLKRTAAGLAILAALPLAAQNAPAVSAAKPSILILGTIHFGGSTADLFSPSVPDILTEKRQHELAEMIAALKRYQPTKIAIESTPEKIGKINAEYQAYLKGDGVMAAAAKNGQQALMDHAMELGKSAVAKIGQKRESSTLGGLFRWLNSPETLMASHRLYLYLAQVGTAADPKGAEVLAGWYRRNLLIYGNLVRLVDSPQERILLLIGQGHAKLLSEYIAESPNLQLADPEQYLP